ncbi:hypothetical protein QYS48_29525 [Marivirga arenosa]|uniref:Uncharacterized protein n=1 Tax=Marivirga arenosa TaxID=3059076 RepID=A0AA51NAT3_9BACT|nr:hypothetical protein [Marivirga sp. ABR2-2]WMN07680.1 hypothetical protein QYS48_29525 [Marivirga sp. ABR2-2]
MILLKRILIGLLILLIAGAIGGFFYFKNKFMSAPPNRLTLTNLNIPFEFTWQGGEINGKYEPYLAMYVPVQIPGVNRPFHMQFDVGAHSTVLYYNRVLSINEKFGEIFKFDTLDNRLYASDVELKVGSVDLKASAIGFRGKTSDIDWSDSNAIIKIGTVGSDFMERYPLIMDFKKQEITLAEKIPDNLEKEAEFLPFTFDGRKIFLSANLNGEPVSLWYDSGSSAFELIVEESTFWELAEPEATRFTFTGNSWGNAISIHNIESNGEFEFGSVKVPLTFVTYIDWPNKLQAFIMKAANMGGDLGGMTGNKLFFKKKLILDAPNLRYAVVK